VVFLGEGAARGDGGGDVVADFQRAGGDLSEVKDVVANRAGVWTSKDACLTEVSRPASPYLSSISA